MYRWNCCMYPTVMAPQNAVSIDDNENGPDKTDTPLVVATDVSITARGRGMIYR